MEGPPHTALCWCWGEGKEVLTRRASNNLVTSPWCQILQTLSWQGYLSTLVSTGCWGGRGEISFLFGSINTIRWRDIVFITSWVSVGVGYCQKGLLSVGHFSQSFGQRNSLFLGAFFNRLVCWQFCVEAPAIYGSKNETQGPQHLPFRFSWPKDPR